MAVMGRKKQSVGRMWAYKNQQTDEESNPGETNLNREVSEEEHQRKMELLKNIGLIKD